MILSSPVTEDGGRAPKTIMITKIDLEHVKGLSRSFQLEPITRIVGPNFSGKTAIADAIAIALLGYSPRLGKPVRDTMGIASDKKMRITAEFSNETQITRSFETVGQSVKSTSEPDLQMSEPMLLDIREWFAMTKAARADYINRNAAAGFSFKSVTDAFDGIREQQLQTIYDDPKLVDAAKTLVDTSAQRIQALIESAEQEGAEPTDVIDACLEEWKTKADHAQATVDRCKGLIQGQAANSAEGSQGADRSQQIAEVNKQLTALEVELGTIEAEEAQRVEAAKELQTVEAELAKLPHDRLASSTVDLQALNRIVQTYKDEENQRFMHLQPDPCRLPREVQAAKLDAERKLAAIDQRIKSETAAVDKAMADLDTFEHGLVKSAKACEHCGAAPEHWTKVDHQKIRLAELRAAVRTAKETLEASQAEKGKLKSTLDSAQAELDKAQASVDAALLKKSAFEEACHKMESLMALRKDHDEKVIRRAGLVGKIDRIGKPGNLEGTIKAKIDRRVALTAELKKLDQENRRFLMERGKLEQSAAARQQVAIAELEVALLKLFIKTMKAFLESQAQSRIREFCDRISQFTKGILPGERIEAKQGEIGYYSPKTGKWVSHECMSGAEKALVYIGLGIAAAGNQSQQRVIVLDEMGILDQAVEAKVWLRMADLQSEKVIDQFIGITSRPITPFVDHTIWL